ncbi:YdaU family protein [Ralstonia insidiosa]|uniref:YdaU family protein n=1 Tax=Ralstonia insidiosa TaxID=190721 RepID=UPI000CEEAFBB|nr:YdaU family protein [Ralstonia insidiosa]
MNFYKRHIGDYIKDAAHLSLLEHGVYARLMDVYYTREAGIPDGQASRLIGARSKEEQQAVQNVLGEFFTLADGVWTQARCEREIGAATAKGDQNRENGKKGGRPRKNPPQNDPTKNPDGLSEENHVGFEKNLSQTPDTTSQTPDKNIGVSAASGPSTVPATAGDWWRHFREKHGLQMDPTSVHDRKKAWPIFTAWCNAGLSLERVDAAVTQAQQQATEPIAFLPGYVDRVLSSQTQRQTNGAQIDNEAENAKAHALLFGQSPEVIDDRS